MIMCECVIPWTRSKSGIGRTALSALLELFVNASGMHFSLTNLVTRLACFGRGRFQATTRGRYRGTIDGRHTSNSAAAATARKAARATNTTRAANFRFEILSIQNVRRISSAKTFSFGFGAAHFIRLNL